MAVFTEESVKANIRNQNGKRVFFLAEGDHLTPSAREWLRNERIDVLSGGQIPPQEYRTVTGARLQEKPEDMTHLRAGILVPKDHPRIRFRGGIDELEAELLVTAKHAESCGKQALVKQLQELLDLIRNLMRCEVLEEPLKQSLICGYSMEQLREQSHHPEKYFDQPHFMPSVSDSELLLRLNRLRTQVRRIELLACDAFQDRDGRNTRQDIVQLLNRISSLIWIWMIQMKKEEAHGR